MSFKSIREFKAASSEEEKKTIDVAAKSDKTEKK